MARRFGSGLRRFPARSPRNVPKPAPTGAAIARCGIVLLVAAASPATTATAGAGLQGDDGGVLRVVGERGERRVEIRRLGGAEMVSLAELAEAVGAEHRSGEDDARFEVGGHDARFRAGRSFVRVDGRTRVLSGPSVRRGGEWFVPLDFVARTLPALLGESTTYDPERRLLASNASLPTLDVDISGRPGATRVTLRTDRDLEFALDEAPGRVRVTIPTSSLETAFLGAAPADGVVQRVDLYQDADAYVLEITTGPNYARMRPRRSAGTLAVELIRVGIPASAEGADELPEPSRGRRERPAPRRPTRIRTVSIDAGHGGEDPGVSAPNGQQEKRIALAVALRLRDLLEADYGYRVVLTRDGDRAVAPDDRAAVANTARADVLVSIHVNGSQSAETSGSRVHFADGGGAAGSDEAIFVRWANAQDGHAEASRLLAQAIANELEPLPGPVLGIAAAPIRLLRAAAMPAAHVELGFLTSEADRVLLGSGDFQRRAAEALARGIRRFGQAAGPDADGRESERDR